MARNEPLPGADPIANAAAPRRRIGLAFVTALGTRGVTALVQLAAVPLLARALGPTDFGLMLVATSGLGFLLLANAGINPAVTRAVAAAVARADVAGEAGAIRAALRITVLLAAGFGALALAVIATVPAASLIGAAAATAPDAARPALLAAAVLVALQLLTSVGEAIRAGYNEQHVNNGFAAAAQAGILLAVGAFLLGPPSVVGAIVALYAPPVVVGFANAALLLRRLARRGVFAVPPARSHGLFRDVWAFAAVQAGSFAELQLTTVIVGYRLGAEAAAVFGGTIRMLLIATGVFVSLGLPLMPALVDANARGDTAWVRLAWRRATFFGLAASAAYGLVIAGFGDWLLRAWLGISTAEPRAFWIAAGVYFVGWMWGYLQFTVSTGVGAHRQTARVLVVQALLAIAAGTAVVGAAGPAGMMVALAGATLAVTSWSLPWLVWRRIGHPAAVTKVR